MNALTLQHDDGIAVVTIDVPGAQVNTVTAGLRAEFAALFAQIDGDRSGKGVVLLTGKTAPWLGGPASDE